MTNPIIVAGKKNRFKFIHDQKDVCVNLLEIQKSCLSCDNIILDKYKEQIDERTENLIIITNKEFDISQTVPQIIVSLVQPTDRIIKITTNNGGTIKNSSILTDINSQTRKKTLNQIMTKFNEPKDNTCAWFLFGVVIFYFTLMI